MQVYVKKLIHNVNDNIFTATQEEKEEPVDVPMLKKGNNLKQHFPPGTIISPTRIPGHEGFCTDSYP
jgi:hypothetical protein